MVVGVVVAQAFRTEKKVYLLQVALFAVGAAAIAGRAGRQERCGAELSEIPFRQIHQSFVLHGAGSSQDHALGTIAARLKSKELIAAQPPDDIRPPEYRAPDTL